MGGLSLEDPCGCYCQLRGRRMGFPVPLPSSKSSNCCSEPKGGNIYGLITGLLILIYMPPMGLTRGSEGERDVCKYVSGLPITQPANLASEQEVSWVNGLHALCLAKPGDTSHTGQSCTLPSPSPSWFSLLLAMYFHNHHHY